MRPFQTIKTLFVSMVLAAALLAASRLATAADSPVGTYVSKAANGKPEITMKIEQWAPGKAKLTYHIQAAGNMVLTIVSSLDGKDAPVLINGKPTGETMAITLIDKLHSSTVVKMNGKVFGNSKGTFSPDFKTLTVENDFSSAGGGTHQAGKSTELWTRQ